jgi:hypothetical protein
MRVSGLDGFQNSQQRSGLAGVLCNRLVNQQLFLGIQLFMDDTLHDSSASQQTSLAA